MLRTLMWLCSLSLSATALADDDVAPDDDDAMDDLTEEQGIEPDDADLEDADDLEICTVADPVDCLRPADSFDGAFIGTDYTRSPRTP